MVAVAHKPAHFAWEMLYRREGHKPEVDEINMTIAKTVKTYFDACGVSFGIIAHPKTFSTKETAAVSHIHDDHIAKAVILKDKRGAVMVIIPGDNWIKLRTLQRELNRPLKLASEQALNVLFGDCQPGAIPALGPAYGIETILDEALRSLAYVYIEAGDHEHLVRITGAEFCRLHAGARHGFFSHPQA